MNHKDLQNLSEAYSNLYPYDGGRRVPLEIQKYTKRVLDDADKTRKQRNMRTKETVPVRVNKETGEKKPMFENTYDLYDIILSHLLDEGYADTFEAAEVMMVHMSEEWRDSICEELTGERRTRALEKGGYLANRVARGKEGQPLERRNRGGDVTMRTTTKGPTKRGGMGFKGKTKSDWYGTDDAHGSGNKSRKRRGMEVKDTSDDL